MSKNKLHWTQRPENKNKLKKQLNKMNKIKNAKKNGDWEVQEHVKVPKVNEVSLIGLGKSNKDQSADSPEPFRASKNSYVLIMGTRVPIRDLSHESLCDRYTLIANEVSNLQRELNTLQELADNLRAEKFYRNL